jgi:hypothetical protein
MVTFIESAYIKGGKVQIKFIKYICYKSGTFFKSSAYPDMCSRFNIPSLKARRDVLDLNFLHKCLNNKYNTPHIISETPFYCPSRSLRSHNFFLINISRINLRKFSFLPRVFNVFNLVRRELPDLDIFSPFSTFKTILCNHFYT